MLISVAWTVETDISSESPRFLMKRGPEHYVEAYKSLLHLRGLPLLAAKELFYVHIQMERERELLSPRSNDAERHPKDHKTSKKLYSREPKGLRKRKGRHCDNADQPDAIYGSSPVPNEKMAHNSGYEGTSGDKDNHLKHPMPSSSNRRHLARSMKYWMDLWHQFMAPQTRSINYWQKIGQLLTERRIRRVFQIALSLFNFANHRIGHHLSRGLYDITTALRCQCISIL